MAASTAGARRRLKPVGVVVAAAGLVLFAWSVRQTGVATIADGIERVGAGFLAILALSGLRFWVRARAWSLATEGPAPLPTRDTFSAIVAGDALGNLTPLGPFVSEPVKAAFARARVPLMTALAGIAVENLAYSLSVAAMIAAGTAALLLLLDPSDALRRVAIGVLLGLAVLIVAVAVVLSKRIRLAAHAVAWLDRRAGARSGMRQRLDDVRKLEDLVHGFATRHPRRLPGLLLLELSFHALGIVEMWLTLGLLLGGAAPTLLNTFVLESVNRTIMVVFKIVPLRLGVDEIGTELLTRTIGLPAGVGVTMAIVRKARMVAWAAAGVGVLARRGFRLASAPDVAAPSTDARDS
jgi:hypothetical protein